MQVLISEVTLGAILGPILFNIFHHARSIKELWFLISNFSDGNINSVASKNRDTLLETLKNKSKPSVNWFRSINMIMNPDKFPLMSLQKSTKKVILEKLQIDNNEIKFNILLTLLLITIDN